MPALKIIFRSGEGCFKDHISFSGEGWDQNNNCQNTKKLPTAVNNEYQTEDWLNSGGHSRGRGSTELMDLQAREKH